MRPYIEMLRRRERTRRNARQRRAAEVRVRLGALAANLESKFGVLRVYVFGSLLTGELWEDSDVDLAVEGLDPGKYFRALDLACTLARRPVDLVRIEEAPPALRERILDEGVLL